MQTWLYLAGVMVFSVCLLQWLWLRRARMLLSGLPSYPELPLVGNLLQFWGDGKHLYHTIQDLSEKSEQAIKPFLAWAVGYPVIVFSDAEDVKTINNTFLEKPYYYNFGKEWLGDGLVTGPAHIWKKNIKKLAGSFNATVVEDYQMVFNAQAHKLVANLKGKVGAEPFDAMHLIAYATLETICQTALGEAGISDSVTTEQYYEAFNRALELLIKRGLNFLMHLDCVYRLTRDHKEYLQCVAVIDNVSDMILKKRIMERNMNETKCAYKTEQKFKAFIDILLDMKEADPQMTEHQMKWEMNTIIVGGQETTASTMFYALLILGSHPEVQQKLYKELESIFGGTCRPVTKEDLCRMRYCEAVIYEILRLYPPLPAVMRMSDREIQLKSCTVPKNAMCCINMLGAGRSRRTWGERAAVFDPERWLDGSMSKDNAILLSFSYGRRSCIGKKYAIAVMKTMLAYCIRELQFSSEAHKLEFKIDIALRPVAGHLIQVQLRN